MSILALAVAIWTAPAEAQAPFACAVPAEMMTAAVALERAKATLGKGRALTIVAIGSATTAGAGGSSADTAYPQRMAEALLTRFGVRATVVNLAAARLSATDWVARLESDVLPPNPDIVIWETGTVDAVRGVDVQQFAAALTQGVESLRAHAIGVLLVDPQYSKRMAAMVNLGPYIDAIRMIADNERIALFDRHQIMKHWADEGYFHIPERANPAAIRENDRVYACIGALLATQIAQALDRKELVSAP
jgi:hypothetical protein